MNRSLLGLPRGRSLQPGPFGWAKGEGLRNFPVDVDRVTTISGSATSHDVNLPTGLAAGQDMLIAVLGLLNAAVSASWPSGWQILDAYTTQGSHATQIAWRVVDGTEGAVATVTLGGSSDLNAICYRVAYGHVEKAPAYATAGSSTNPPFLQPGRGSIPFLWIGMSAGTGNPNAVYSEGFENPVTCASGSCRLKAASRQFVVDRLDPSDFPYNTGPIRSWLIAVPPKGYPV